MNYPYSVFISVYDSSDSGSSFYDFVFAACPADAADAALEALRVAWEWDADDLEDKGAVVELVLPGHIRGLNPESRTPGYIYGNEEEEKG